MHQEVPRDSRGSGAEAAIRGVGTREAASGRVVGGAPGERGRGGGGQEGDDGCENPGGAGRAGTSRSGCGGASGASSAEGGGWLAGTVTSRCRGRRSSRTASRTGTQASGQAAPAPPPARGQTTRPVPALGASAAPRPAPATPPLGQRHGVGRWAALWAPSSPPRPDRPRGPAEEPRLDVKRKSQCLPANSVGTMASLMPLSPYLSPTVLLLVSCDLGFVRADRPPSPVNVTVTHLRANSATVSWDVPEGNIVIGYSISQQRQNGPGQRVIREVNTTTRACALWGLAEDSDYTVQVRSIGLRGESPPGPRVHFRTLKGSDRLPSNSSSPGDITVEGLDGERPLQTGEVVIIVVVLLMWAAVIGLFCRQYDIIKDNDSNNNPKEKGKGPEQSPQGRPVGTRQKKSPSINTIDV
ncbi:fibronectin type III domain-containing protein 4 [Suricata suricatta]|uniref:fibronectin type III domain-containing protein 4 n=1 Tax=Suricata suricatta TaxID=37032 RepID=UPI001155388B|nr:fibronectin type III domain-containing protein 4 [Suricata suricatta]